MKIIFLSNADLSVIKGTRLRIFNIIKNFSMLTNVDAFSFSKGESPFDKNIKHYNLNNKSLWSISKKIKKISPDIIYFNCHNTIFMAFILRIFFRNRFLYAIDLHGDYYSEVVVSTNNVLKKTKIALFDYIQKRMLKIFHVVFVVCRPLKKLYSKYAKSIKLFPACVDLAFFKDSTQNKPNRIKIMYIGNSMWYQGITYLLDAIEYINNDFDNDKFQFEIISNLDTATKEFYSKYDNVIIKNYVTYAEVPKLLQSADILVIPRPYSDIAYYAIPSKLPEYGALKKAVICTDVGDHSEYIKDNVTGLLIEPGSVSQLVDAIYSLKEKEFREKLGRNIYNLIAEKYIWFKYVNDFYALFEEMLNDRSPYVKK